MTKTKTLTRQEQNEKQNAPYLIDAERPCRLVRNYEMLPSEGIDNGLVLDYIDCSTPEEAKHLRGFLWNAFAGGRAFANATRSGKTSVLHKDDFTEHALSIGIWEGLTEDHGVDPSAEEIEIAVSAVKKVA